MLRATDGDSILGAQQQQLQQQPAYQLTATVMRRRWLCLPNALSSSSLFFLLPGWLKARTSLPPHDFSEGKKGREDGGRVQSPSGVRIVHTSFLPLFPYGVLTYIRPSVRR